MDGFVDRLNVARRRRS